MAYYAWIYSTVSPGLSNFSSTILNEAGLRFITIHLRHCYAYLVAEVLIRPLNITKVDVVVWICQGQFGEKKTKWCGRYKSYTTKVCLVCR